MTARAFTLVELLAVIAILSIVAATTATGLGGVSKATRIRETIAALQDLDGRCRQHARRHGPLELRLADEGEAVVALDGETVVLDVLIPPALTVTITPTPVAFDGRGCGPDYEVRAGDRVWTVLGLTGLIEERNP